jgi:hypothetical protein
MDHPDIAARKAAEPPEVEVERVVEACRRASREPIDLDIQSASTELGEQREQELVPATVGGRVELVEKREIGASSPRSDPGDFSRDSTLCRP